MSDAGAMKAGFMAIGITLAACGGSGSSEPDRLLPGPCSARFDSTTEDIHAEYTYDEAGRLATYSFDADQGVEIQASEWTWSASGELETVVAHSACDLCPFETFTWTFTASGVTLVQSQDDPYTEDHEAGARFLGDPFEMQTLRTPRSPDSLLSHVSDLEDVTYTYSGPPREGTRVRTGSDASEQTFVYDDDGNLVEWFGAGFHETYLYANGVVVQQTHGSSAPIVYQRDSYGNLLSTVQTQGTPIVYDYSCW